MQFPIIVNKKLIYSFLVNFVFLFLFWGTDVYIVLNFDTTSVASWALFKSVIFIGVTLVTLGVDQAVVRLNLKPKDILAPAIFQFFIISVVTGVIIFFIGIDLPFIYVVISLFCYAVLMLLFSFERSRFNYTYSLIILNLWKVIFFIIIVSFLNKNIFDAVLISFLISLGFLIRPLSKINFNKFFSKKYKISLETGFYYFLSLSSLNITLFLDQIILDQIANKSISEVLFTHITFFVSPIAALLGFVGFLITPYLRDNPHSAISWYKNRLKYIVIFGLLMCVSIYYFSSFLFIFLKNERPDMGLGISLLIIIFFRFLLIIPSSFFGSLASANLVKKIAIWYNLINIIYVGLVLVSFTYLNFNPLFSIVFALLITWFLRMVVGFIGVKDIIKNYNYIKE